jgi:triosephosphate isomerase
MKYLCLALGDFIINNSLIGDMKMRRTVIAGNWKMNMTPSQTKSFITELIPMVSEMNGCDIVLCVPYVDIAAALEAAKGTNIHVGAENVHFAESGAYTGEISTEMLREVGCEYVIVGHSERRRYFGETDETVNLRAKAALFAGFKTIICLGEVKEERLAGVTNEVLTRQTRLALAGIGKEEFKKVILAYEPVWAIGTGLNATPEQADEACGEIRAVVRELYGSDTAENVRILYGGSMNENNASELLSAENVDGGLIGGASLKTDKFTAIVKAAN